MRKFELQSESRSSDFFWLFTEIFMSLCKWFSFLIDVCRDKTVKQKKDKKSCNDINSLKFQRKKVQPYNSFCHFWFLNDLNRIFPLKAMAKCLECVNNCLHFLNLCKPKESINNTKTSSSNDSTKLLNMSKHYTLMLPTRPKPDDEIRIKAKLKDRPKE